MSSPFNVGDPIVRKKGKSIQPSPVICAPFVQSCKKRFEP